MSETSTPVERKTAAEILTERYALDAAEAEPLAKAAARLFRTNPAHTNAVLEALRANKDSIGPEYREVFTRRLAWTIYCQSAQAGGVPGLPPGLKEDAFAERALRDKVAEPISAYVAWREALFAAHGGKPAAELLIDGFGLQDQSAEPLAAVAVKFLRLEPNFASDMLDMTRTEDDPSPVRPQNREKFLCGFAAVMYERCDGKLQDVPGNLKGHAFERPWIRKLVAKALADMAVKEPEQAQAQAQKTGPKEPPAKEPAKQPAVASSTTNGASA